MVRILLILLCIISFSVGYGTFWLAGQQLEAQVAANKYEAQYER